MSEAKARAAMTGRGLGRCELCGSTDAIQASHRIGRAQGGPWTPANVLALCARDHAWLTEHRDIANAGGWILAGTPAGTGITDAPVYLRSAGLWPGWFTLDERGDAHPTDRDDTPTLPPWLTGAR